MGGIIANAPSATINATEKDQWVDVVTDSLTEAQKDKFISGIGISNGDFGQRVNSLTSSGLPSIIGSNITAISYNALADKVIATTNTAGTIVIGSSNSAGGIDWVTQSTLTSIAWTGCVSSPTATLVYSTASTTYNYSTDGGSTWLSSTFTSAPFVIAYGNGSFVAMLSNSTWIVSTDGINWGAAAQIGGGVTATSVQFLRYLPSEDYWFVGFAITGPYYYLSHKPSSLTSTPFGTSAENASYAYTSIYPYDSTGIASTRNGNGTTYGEAYNTMSTTSTLPIFNRSVTAFAQDDTGLKTLFVNSTTSSPHFYSDNSLYLSDIKNEAGTCVCYAGGSFKQFVIGTLNGRFQHTQRGI